jgi:uncharacterized protein YutE (UPF0331/DUF86 family)
MTLDRELLARKLLLVVSDIDALRDIEARGVDAYLSNTTDQAVVERHLQRAVGRMIDVNYHLITAAGQPPPPDYHASFLKLAGLSVVDAEFARRLARAAGLRNRLVHDYDDLDPARVFEALQAARTDIPQYVARVREYLNRQQPD